MSNQEPLKLLVQVRVEEGDAEELDILTRQLLSEIWEQEVETAELFSTGTAPQGTKAADPVTLGAIAVAVLPSVFPKLVEFMQAWTLRGQGRTVKFKGKVGGQDLEFEGTAEDLKSILGLLSDPQKTEDQPGDLAK